jgi:peptidyl-prolyl cis-trans isomerase D
VNQFRKYARFFVMFILFGMLIVSFGFWGIGDMLRMNRGTAEVAHVGGIHIPIYGYIGGTSVTVEEVRDSFNRQLEGIQRQTGQRPDTEQAVRFGLHMRALEEAVQRAVLEQAIREFGLSVGDEEIRTAIAQNPLFQGNGGKFDPMQYRARLSSARISEAQYIADMRRQIAASQLFGAVRAEGLAPKVLRDDIFRLEGEKRVAETVYVPDAIVTDVPKPTTEQISTYFEANKTKFQIPEFRAFSYVMLTLDDVADKVSVSGEQIRQEYESRTAEFQATEKRDIDQVMADTADKAKAVAAAVAAGKSLEDAAKEVLGNSGSVIKLGVIEKKELPPGPLADGIFALPVGTSTTPIQSPLGWHIVRVNKLEPGKVTPLEEVKDKIERDLRAQMMPDLLLKLVTDFERSLSKTQSMSAAAQELGVKVRTVENADAQGNDPTGKPVVVGPGAAELLQTAFATREGTESQLVETPHGEYFVVRTDRVTPSRVPALSEVEPKVIAAWQAAERRRLAEEKVKAAIEKVNAGGDLGAEAKALGLELRTTKPVSRFDADTGNYLTQPAVVELFKLQPGKTTSIRTAEGTVLVRLKEVQPVDPAKEADALDRFGKQLDGMMANDLVLEFVTALRLKYGVTVNEAVFAEAFKNDPTQQQQQQ